VTASRARPAPELRRGSIDRVFEFSLLGLLASSYAAVAGSGFLDLPTLVLGAAALALRGLIVAGVARADIPDRWVTALTIGYIGFVPLDYLYVSGELMPATVHLVFFVAIVKLLTARTRRDYFFLKVIAFLQLLAAAVLSSSLNFFAFLALFLVFAVATFASSEIRRSAGSARLVSRAGLPGFSRRLAALTLATSLGILAMSAGMFFLLPRTARAAFQHLVSDRYRLPGFSDQIVLGQMGEIKRQSNPVMHVRIASSDGPMPLKWRGAALSRFDGRRWSNPPVRGQVLRIDKRVLQLVPDQQRRRSGVRISYEVSLKGIASDALFFAGAPEFLIINAPTIVKTAGDSYRLGYGTSDGLRYGAYSLIEDPRAPPPPGEEEAMAEAQRAGYLLLPAIDPRIPALARRITAGIEGDGNRAAAIERHLASYQYSTELLPSEVPDPLAHFLFERRRGHCEYFASAMAVMLRSIQIPARVVTGFQSGIYNPVSGWHVIRAADAHSWVEAWIPGSGWRTYDPTPPDPQGANPGLFTRLAMYLDAAETFWQEWVLSYNLDRQMALAYKMEESGRNLRLEWLAHLNRRIQDGGRAAWGWLRGRAEELLAALVIAAGLLLAAPHLWKRWRFHRRAQRARRGEVEAGDAALLYLQMLELLKRRGYERPSWLTPNEFAALLPPSPAASLVSELTAAYNALRFGGRAEAAPRVVALLEELRLQLSSAPGQLAPGGARMR